VLCHGFFTSVSSLSWYPRGSQVPLVKLKYISKDMYEVLLILAFQNIQFNYSYHSHY
jgi:hypothetical protein